MLWSLQRTWCLSWISTQHHACHWVLSFLTHFWDVPLCLMMGYTVWHFNLSSCYWLTAICPGDKWKTTLCLTWLFKVTLCILCCNVSYLCTKGSYKELPAWIIKWTVVRSSLIEKNIHIWTNPYRLAISSFHPMQAGIYLAARKSLWPASAMLLSCWWNRSRIWLNKGAIDGAKLP